MTSKQAKKLCKVYAALKAFIDGGYETERALMMAAHDYKLSVRDLKILREALANNGLFTS